MRRWPSWRGTPCPKKSSSPVSTRLFMPPIWRRCEIGNQSMDEDMGAPPRSGSARLVPELLVEDIAISLPFWRDRLGLPVAHPPPGRAIGLLEAPEGAPDHPIHPYS